MQQRVEDCKRGAAQPIVPLVLPQRVEAPPVSPLGERGADRDNVRQAARLVVHLPAMLASQEEVFEGFDEINSASDERLASLTAWDEASPIRSETERATSGAQ